MTNEHKPGHRRVAFPALVALLVPLLTPAAVFAADGPVGRTAAGTLSGLMGLSLEELMSLEVTVTSAAKRPQRMGDTAAAMFVLTGEEIRRSGATSIPDALRLVPGVQVARISSNRWFVTARGFGGSDANKLLVLIDGVSSYTPLFSGILWGREGVFLEDVERIEVIRGPGAALWGANAVNGVINIVTKPAAATTGGLVSATVGTQERGSIGARYGGRLGDAGHARIYAEGTARDAGGADSPGSGEDHSRFGRAGFRADLELSPRDRLTVQGDMFHGTADDATYAPLLTPPYVRMVRADMVSGNANVLGRWRRTLAPASHLLVQGYYQHSTFRGRLGNFREQTVDVEAEHRFALSERDDFIWGMGARWYRSDIEDGLISARGTTRTSTLFSVFAQNEHTLVPDRLKLTAGAKAEYRETTGLELQPTVRAVWTPHEDHVVWAAVSRAVRTPSRAEQDFVGVQQVIPTGRLPLAIALTGSEDLASEKVVAYEVGYRVQPVASVSLDVAAFYNTYTDLRGFRVGAPAPVRMPVPHLLLPVSAANSLEGETYGVEVAAEWDVRPGWRLRGAYSALKMHIRNKDGSAAGPARLAESGSPAHQVILRSSHDLGSGVQLDLTARAVDDLGDGIISGYAALDVSLAWHPTEQWELALVGQNLIGPERMEATPGVIDLTPSRVQRGVYARVIRRF
ncbi:TonB-dependent receptor plug domain-containing protein [Azospirillum halopraeferens]|uniref:TonB-dependent receptor plug domain-containing protein n=1 Tax=Azospirillum halopraeferens TaxID=34010 RepID=UPI0012EB903D|nr:TonB-dependent receptor [Azospirillum halopraeferens]